MARYTTTVNSPHPPEVVFDAMADFTTVADWDPNVSASERIEGDGPVGLGAKFKVLNSFFGRKQTLYYEIVEFERPDRFVIEAVDAAFTSTDTITVVADGEGSAMTYDAVITLSGIGRWFDVVLGLLFRIIGSKARAGLVTFLEDDDLPNRAGAA